MSAYVNTTIHFPDPVLLEKIRAFAKARGVSPSAYMRDAASRAVARDEKKNTRPAKKRAA